MRSGNPALNETSFPTVAAPPGERMTLGGVVNKTAILLLLVVATAGWVWQRFLDAADPGAVMPFVWVGVGGGFVAALVTIFAKRFAPVTAPLYALLEGLAIGGISAMFEARFPGIVLQAVGLTFATLLSLLLAYRSGLIRVTQNFRLGVVAATGGIALLYLVNLALTWFGRPIGFIHEGGTVGILFSLFVVAIAALNLVLDFDFIEAAVEKGSPKSMEWYGAFGLIVTLVWLYLEILRLLGKMRR